MQKVKKTIQLNKKTLKVQKHRLSDKYLYSLNFIYNLALFYNELSQY